MEDNSPKYEIALSTWYQEKPLEYETERCDGLLFDTLEEATEYLYLNIDRINSEYPVIEISIRLDRGGFYYKSKQL